MMSISTFLNISYPNVILIVLSLGFKQNKHKYELHYMMMSQILKSVDFTKIQKSRYLGFMVKPHTSDIRMTYEYIRVTYGWHTSDIGMTYEYIQVTYGWHTSDIGMTYKYIRKTYGWHMSDIGMTNEYIRVT